MEGAGTLMTAEERYKITSEDFADLMLEYNLNMRTFDRFPDATIQIMNDKYAIVYVPASQLNARTINQYGYSVVPACYGLDSAISLEASGVTRLRRLPAFDLLGEGVLIGIIDTGIDYTHPAFLHEDGTTRITAIWDQTIESDNFPQNYFYGTQYLAEEINRALQSENPLEIVPSRDEIGHGTALAGIAAGSEIEESNFSGVAPFSDLVIVKLKQAKSVLRDFFIIPQDVPCYQENDIMWGFQYIIEAARNLNRPVAVCVGLGSSQGSHDGHGALSDLLSTGGDFSGVAVVISAGNEGNARRHFYSEIDEDIGYSTLEISVADDEPGFSMEIWGAAPNTYSIDILSPTGEYIPRIPEGLRVTREIGFVFERTTITVDYQMVETSTGDQLILLRFRDPTPGIWRLQVYTRGDLRGTFHTWLPVDEFILEDTYFVQSDPYTTITSPGNSPVPITVTAYNPDNNNLYQRSSRGYSRIDVIKPEVAAPGVNLQSPDLSQGFGTTTGTGAAAAHTAGIAALLLQWGIVRENYPGIDTVEVKKFIIRGTRTNPSLVYPNRDWGYGILDIYNVFNVLRAESQPTPSI
jgi:subtilisin family serine protease